MLQQANPSNIFSNPFSPSRPNRSLSTSSTSSFRTCLSSSPNSNTPSPSISNPSTPLSISSVLFHSPLHSPLDSHSHQTPNNNNNNNLFSSFRSSSFSYKSSFSSTSSSTTVSASSSRRPSCFSLADVEEEKAEFGEQCVGVLEPRPEVGWWGVREILEEES